MSEIINEVRKGFYLDSVALMRLSAEISAIDGIEEAVLMIGTPSNLQIMQDAGILNDTGTGASPNDLVIALRADRKASANRALAQAQKSLEGGALKSTTSDTRARTLRGGLAAHHDANLALISTPGTYAGSEARQALDLGMNVMIFSDNVSVGQEVSLKQQAREDNLLVMGPDCGTAYINGIPLAFANAIATGTTAAIAASGTGLQEFSVLLTKLGGGLKHGIGVGGRDLSDTVGAISTLTAIDLLASDDSIEQIVVISKPPGPATAKVVFDKLVNCGKPVIACVFGMQQSSFPDGIKFAATLRDAAELATGTQLQADDVSGSATQLADALAPTRKNLLGLYTGGTLCTETQLILQRAGLAVTSNAPAPGASDAAPHKVIDLGADEYTVGRPHPMMEPAARTPLLQSALADPELAVIMLDVVLGYGSHNNPAASIVEALATAGGGDLPIVIASICGTEADPQGYWQQHKALYDAGVVICNCNTSAAELSAAIINLPGR